MRENPLAPPKPPNKELLDHERKRKREAQVFAYRKKLLAEHPDLKPEVLDEKIKAYRESLTTDVVKDSKNQQEAALAKEEHMSQLRHALNIKQGHEVGEAFDMELQEQKRTKKMVEREMARKEEKHAKKEEKRAKERELL